MSLPHLPSTAGLDRVVAAVAESGAVVIDHLITGPVLDRLSADLDPWLRATSPGSASDDPEWQLFHGHRTKRFAGITAKSRAIVEVMLDPLVLSWAEQALLPACGSIQCAGTQAMAIGPGEPAQYLHRDQSAWSWFNRLLPDGPEVTVSALVALTDFRAENGATRVVPGSHRHPDHDDLYDPDRSVPAEMDAGSVLLFSGRTVHGGGANRTATSRVGVHLAYALGWLRPEEAHPFVVDAELARTLPARARQLLGFTQYDPAPRDGGRLWTVDVEDPADLFGGR